MLHHKNLTVVHFVQCLKLVGVTSVDGGNMLPTCSCTGNVR